MRIIIFNRCQALVLAFLCLFSSYNALAQVQALAIPGPGTSQRPAGTVTWPIEGAVFQQDVNGKGQIPVLGHFNSLAYIGGLYTIQATLIPLDVKTGNPIPNATPINQTITGRNTAFSTTFTNVNAGWYALRVTFTAQRQNMRSYSAEITKVGIGEVFIIAGQSNAQGLPNTQNVSDSYKVAQPFAVNTNAYDGVRVDRFRNTASITDVTGNIPDLRKADQLGLYSQIARLTGVNNLVNDYDAGIAPTGNSLWYWAKLGEKIVNQKNVPVAFFNAAWGGTTITEWERSIDVNKKVFGKGNPNDPNKLWGSGQGVPFALLSRTLNLYTSLYGVRAVLWMQGETDNSTQVDGVEWGEVKNIDNWDHTIDSYDRTVHSSQEYAQKLQHIISESRSIFQNRALTWVIAKASFNVGVTNNLVRDGQEAVISSGIPNILRGPDMDQIIGVNQRRNQSDVVNDQSGAEPTHLKGIGLTDAADAWFNALNGPGKLLNGAAPPITQTDLGTTAQSIVVSADGQTLSAPAGTTFRWLDESSGKINPNQPVSISQNINAVSSCGTCPVGESGYRRALVQNGNGNFIITQAVPYPYYIVDDTQQPATPTAACYTIKVDKTGKRLQAMSTNSVLQQPINNAADQVWKLDDRGNGRVSFTVQDGTDRAIQATNGANNGAGLALSGYTANGLFDWTMQANPANANLWRVYYPANNNTWDMEGFADLPTLQIYGNTSEPFFDYRSFQFEPASCPTTSGSCNFTPSVVSNVANPGCGQTVQLTANCSGANCDQLIYNWNGTGQTSQSINVTLPNANGSYNYAVTVSRPGCSNNTAGITLNVSGCGGGTGGTNGASALTTVRAYFRTDNCAVCQDRCANSVIQGSADNTNWTTLATLPRPNPGWNDYAVNGASAYRYLRYVAAGGCYGELNELEFYAGGTKLSGSPIGGGSPANNDPGLVYQSALDGNLGTFWHGSNTGPQNYAGLDLGSGGGTTTSGCNLPTSACYTINVDQTGKRLQAMGDNSIQQQTVSNSSNQIWKVDNRGNGQVSFTTQDGSGRVIQAVSAPSDGVGLSLGGYTGTYQHWAIQCNPAANAQWRVFSPVSATTWDLQGYASLPVLQLYGNTGESFGSHRSFRFEPATCPNGRKGVAEPLVAETDLNLLVLPNPNNGQFIIRFQTKAGQEATLRLSDLNGRHVRPVAVINGTGQTHEEVIKLPAQVRGLLLLEVVSGQQRGTQKVLIE